MLGLLVGIGRIRVQSLGIFFPGCRWGLMLCCWSVVGCGGFSYPCVHVCVPAFVSVRPCLPYYRVC